MQGVGPLYEKSQNAAYSALCLQLSIRFPPPPPPPPPDSISAKSMAFCNTNRAQNATTILPFDHLKHGGSFLFELTHDRIVAADSSQG